jgi:hypothetical protein
MILRMLARRPFSAGEHDWVPARRRAGGGRMDRRRDSEYRWFFVRVPASARGPMWRIVLGPICMVSVVAVTSACRDLRVRVMARHLA